MADAVASQTLSDGGRKAVVKLTNVSDGTGESAVTKVDVSALANAPERVKIERVWYATAGLSVRLLWDATADVVAMTLPPDDAGCLDFTPFGGLINNAGAGVTGDVKLTTSGASAGDSYTLVLEMAKS